MIDNTVIQWKGLTFQQISAGIKFNKPTANKNFFTANSLKIYRKEIASTPLTQCSQRSSTKIDDFNRPGGVITTSISNTTGLVNTLDMNYEKNLCQHPQPSCNVIITRGKCEKTC